MTICQQSLQSEDQSPQPNSSGYPLEVTVHEEMPGPSVKELEAEDASPPPEALGPKRNREWSSEDEDQDEDEETVPKADYVWEVETLCGLKMKLKRRRVSAVRPEHHEIFHRLLDDPVITGFLAWDSKLRVSDKYLLAMVVAYFGRAGLSSWQYWRIHLFLALYLANDMEEADETPKQAIFSFLYGKDRSQRPFFHKQRFQFFRSMGYNVRVSKEECEEIMAFNPGLWVWGRERVPIPEATEA